MKIADKQEVKHIAFNYSSDIDFKYFMDIPKMCTAKPYHLLANDTTLASDNPSYAVWRCRCNLFEIIWKLIMTNDDKIRDEKIRY